MAVGKSASPYFAPQTTMSSNGLGGLYLRAGGAALVGGGAVEPLVHLALDAAWLPMVDLL
mgnify:CR=1 FL=1